MIETELYDGNEILKFDEHHHVYRVDDNIVPSVTSICGIIDKGWPPNYIKSQARKYFKENIETRFPGSKENIIGLHDESLDAHKKHSSEAMEIGSHVHSTVESMLRDPSFDQEWDEDMSPSISAFLKFYLRNDIEPDFLEKKIYSKKYNYAGTLDFAGRLNGEQVIIDWKTSSTIRDKHKLQLSAYHQAMKEEGFEYHKGVIVRLGKDADLEIRRLDKEELERHFEVFEAALELYRFKRM